MKVLTALCASPTHFRTYRVNSGIQIRLWPRCQLNLDLESNREDNHLWGTVLEHRTGSGRAVLHHEGRL